MIFQNILFALFFISCSAVLSQDPLHSGLVSQRSFVPKSSAVLAASNGSSQGNPPGPIISIPITSDNNGIYANLSLGSDNHNYKVLIDTDYSWLTLMPQDSENNDGSLFNCPSSETCNTSIIDLHSIAYKSRNIDCYVVQEQTSMNNHTFRYQFLTTHQNAFQSNVTNLQVSGLLGLRLMTPETEENEQKLSELDIEANSLNYVQALKNNGLIEKSQFSIYLSPDPTKNSTLIFGGYDANSINGTSTEIPVIADNNWALNVTGIRVGKTKLPLKNATAVISTLVPGIIFPQAAINNIYDDLIENSLCTTFTDSICYCGETPCEYNPDYFPDLSISFEGFQANIPGRLYVQNKSGTNELLIKKNEGNDHFIWLGHIFIQQYVPLFNMENKTISLVQSIDFIHSSGLNTYMPYYILITALLLIAVIALGLFFFNKNQEEKNSRARSESESLLTPSACPSVSTSAKVPSKNHKKSFDHIGL